MKKLLVFTVVVGLWSIGASGVYEKYVAGDNIAVAVIVADSTYSSQTFAIGSAKGFSALKGRVVLNPSPVTLRGYGLADSGFLRLYSNFAGEQTLIAQDSSAGLPCTLSVRVLPAVGDTLLGDYLECIVSVYDSLGDTAMAVTHPVHWNFLLK